MFTRDLRNALHNCHSRGFRTHALGKWHLGYCREEFAPHRRGFDTFNGYMNGAEHYFTHIRDPDRVSFQNFTPGFDYYAAAAPMATGSHPLDWAQNMTGPFENTDPTRGDCYSAHHLSATAAAIVEVYCFFCWVATCLLLAWHFHKLLRRNWENMRIFT